MELRILNRYKIALNRIYTEKDFQIPDESRPANQDEGKENFFVHIHLPKTGGSTFNTVLNQNFGKEYEPFEGRFMHMYPHLNNSQMMRFVNLHTGINCVSSHAFRAVLPYRSTNKNLIAIAFIRDPVDRFFSFYFHKRFRYGEDCIEKRLLLPEFISHVEKNVLRSGRKGYLTHLTGKENHPGLKYIIELADSNNLYLFPTYEMDKALEILKNAFPDNFKDISYKKENISNKDQEVTDEMRQRAAKMTSKYDWKLLEIAQNRITI